MVDVSHISAPRTRSNEELDMREAVANAWGRARWPDARVVHELVAGECRIDQAFVRPNDLIGVEIKSSQDTLARLNRQASEYDLCFPEWWIAIAPRWRKHLLEETSPRAVRRAGVLIVDGGKVEQVRMARRDELVTTHMLRWLWGEEALAIAERTGVWPAARLYRAKRAKVIPMLARLLTGNEIIKEVCHELRARPAFGQRSDAPVRVAQ